MGDGFTLTVIVAVAVPQDPVPVTVYVVVVVGEAIGLAEVALLKDPEGDHE